MKTRILDLSPAPGDGHIPPSGPGDAAQHLPEQPPRDELDALLRRWHADNADAARAGRDRLLAALRAESAHPALATPPSDTPSRWSIAVRRLAMNRLIPLTVAAVLALAALPFLLNRTSSTAVAKTASTLVMCPDGGRLEAFDPRGLALGPCVLKRTDVRAKVQGPFTRVTVRQKYHNPHPDKIEAVYTFPLSHRAAVDRMNMVIGDRVIVGQVKDRDQARQLYESARDQGLTAGLLEQERPNIFTQSVANIDPGADIDIEISYIETLESRDGQFSFHFPTVVSPRYIPGDPPDRLPAVRAHADEPRPTLPAGAAIRRGLVLAAPAEIALTARREDADLEVIDTDRLAQSLAEAIAIEYAGTPAAQHDAESAATSPADSDPWLIQFDATYPDGFAERGVIRSDFTGEIGGRRFFLPQGRRAWAPPAGEPFSGPTSQVPDAHRITPTPVRPPMRSGHDISFTIEIDTGGPGLIDVAAPIHPILRQDAVRRPDGLASRATITLANQSDIPNRDFVLNWKQTADAIADAAFTSRTPQGDFFTIILNPPARVADEQAVPRELLFVLDTSGSMGGQPIENAKALAARMVDSMRPADTFNFITFAGSTEILWPEPRPNTTQNRAEALAFFNNRQGRGGTEMMTAINAALEQKPAELPRHLTPEELSALPADGRQVSVEVAPRHLRAGDAEGEVFMTIRPGLEVRITNCFWNIKLGLPETSMLIEGVWSTVEGDRALVASGIRSPRTAPVRPLRIVVFLTDGEVGNDMAIIDAIRTNRGTTRVFSYGIGNSVNRYLLAEAARQGGGDAEFILIPSGANPEQMAAVDAAAQAAAARLHTKTRTPLLTGLRVEFSPNLAVADIQPPADQLADLFDNQPLVFHGRLAQPYTGGGSVTVRGMSATGPWERTLTLPPVADADAQPDRRLAGIDSGQTSALASLWARARIDAILTPHLAAVQHGTTPADIRRQVVSLGETFGVLSQFTSFVAIDHRRVTIAGKPRLVRIPIELPDQTAWENYFGADIMFQPVEGLMKKMEHHRERSRTDDTLAERHYGFDPGAVRRQITQATSAATPAPAATPARPGDRGGQANVLPLTSAGLRVEPAAVESPAQMRMTSPPPPPPPPTAKPTLGQPALKLARSADDARDTRSRSFETRVARLNFGASSEWGDDAGLPSADMLDALMFNGNIAPIPISPLEAGENVDSDAQQTTVSPSSRILPLAGSKLILAALQSDNTPLAQRLRDTLAPRFPEAALLQSAAALVPASDAAAPESTTEPAQPRGRSQDRAAEPPAQPPAQPALDQQQVDDLATRLAAAVDREKLLIKHLDPALYALLPGQAGAPTGKQAASRTLTVTILLDNLDDDVLTALKRAGVTILAQLSDVKVVVGTLSPSDLETVATLSRIRKVELVQDTNASATLMP